MRLEREARLRTFFDRGLAFLAFALLVFAALAPVGARAQSELRPLPTPALLTDVTASPGPDGATRILLTFAPHAPTFSVIVGAGQRPAVGFALSSRGATARSPQQPGPLLRQVDFDQEDTVLILRLASAEPSTLTAEAVNGQVIALTLKPLKPLQRTEAAPSAAAPAQALPDGDFVVVPLKYADVSEVVGLLTEGQSVKPNDSFTPREPGFGSAGMNGGAAYNAGPPPTPEGSEEPLGQSVDAAIAVDRRLNAIILRGAPDQIARLKAEIAAIDVPVQSVLLETVFVELTETGAKNVGLDFNNPNGQVAVGTFQIGAFIPPGFDVSHGLGSAELQAAIYAQVQAGNGRIVSKPRISAQSGSTAKIVTGDALPILTAITLSGVNGVSQQVQYVNVGVTLQIAPRVTNDGFVTSHVFCVVSSVTGYSQGYPTISQREAETSATVHDGETFVIGGLTEEVDIATKNKVPALGDVPVAGELFKLGKSTRTKTELYIVVTPHIVRRGEAATDAPPAGADAIP